MKSRRATTNVSRLPEVARLRSSIARSVAFLHRLSISAPVSPSVRSASSRRSTSGASGTRSQHRRNTASRSSADGHGEAEQIVESSAAQERRVHALQAVGRGHQNHALHVAEIVDLAQQLAQDALVDLAAELVLRAVAQLRRDGVDRVEEQDARRRAPAPS